MPNTPISSNLLLHYSAAVAYFIAVVIFLFAWMNRWKGVFTRESVRKRLAGVMVFVLVIGPALYYPIVYFYLKWQDNSRDNGQGYAQHLAGLWGPLWAALAVLWVFLLVERWPKGGTE